MYAGKAFIINLKSHSERRKSITNQLDKQKINYEIIEAVDGKKISPETNPEVDWNYVQENSNWISNGLVACTLSHLKVYRTVTEQDLKYALVIEDDTILSPKLSSFLLNIEDKILKEDVIMLYYVSWVKCLLSTKNSIEVIKHHRILTPKVPGQLASTNAYIITKETCRRILEFQSPMKTTCDSWGVYFENNALKNFRCVYPMLADTGDFKSSIDYIKADSILARTLDIIDKHKIFPFYNILKYRRWKLRRKMLNFELTPK